MYDYNASYLNEQATLLEEFHKIQKYLTEHPLYQVYQSSADYVAGVNEYNINEVSVRVGSTLGVGDVVLFSNVYYGVITEINEVTGMFTIAQGISFRGETGATGPRGGIGPRGLPGEDGNNALEYLGAVVQITYDGDEFNEPHTFTNSDFNRTPVVGDGFLFMYHLNESNLSYIVNGRVTAVGTDTCQVTILPEARQEVTGPAGQTGATGEMGKEGLSIYLYDGELSSSVTSVTLSQINIPTGRTLAVGDILFSSLASTYGAMSIVTDTTGTVNFVGTLTGGGGGGVSDVQINGTSIVSEGVANIPEASDTQAGVMSTSNQYFSGIKHFKSVYIGDDRASSYYCTIASGSSDGTLMRIYPGNTSGVLRIQNGSDTAKRINIHPSSQYISFSNISSGFYSNQRNIYLPFADAYGGGTLMLARNTWSTGTSGSVTLPSGGLYEVKVTLVEGNTYASLIVNWDGSTNVHSANFGTNNLYVQVNGSGQLNVIQDGSTVTNTISYRKIGIA